MGVIFKKMRKNFPIHINISIKEMKIKKLMSDETHNLGSQYQF